MAQISAWRYPVANQLFQLFHFRENSRYELLGEEGPRQIKRICLSQPSIDGDHLATHVVFADLAGAIVSVSRTRPPHDVIRNDTAFQFPVEEAFAGISRPKCAIAVKYCQLG